MGGGGLIAGVATAVKALRPSARVVGVEPAAATTSRARCAPASASRSTCADIADGQQLMTLGARPWAVIRALVDDVVTVTDAEIGDAMRCSSSG